jgi:7,8-dihydropterin-6-yl-methyl-4-(beta-D-ribofuranosyl)aminobenzene 5'-phosphate synthase
MKKNNLKIFLTIFGALHCLCLSGAAWGEAPKRPDGDYILNLYDAFGPQIAGVTQDFGFSALVSWQDKLILFDAGSNADILKSNVAALGIDLKEVDFAIASHSHFDHTNGFDYLLEVNPDVKIYFPNDPFFGAPLPFDATGVDPHAVEALSEDQRYFRGEKTKFTFNQSGRFWGADVEYVPQSAQIAPGVHLIATRSPYMGYFSRYPNMGIAGEASGEEIKTMGLPELSLSLETAQGEVLVVGCSHSLVETITRETKNYRQKGIALVLGGFHLLPYGEADIREMAQRMKDELGVGSVAPAHCTGHLGFKVFSETYGDSYLDAGLGRYVQLPQ